VDAPLVRVVNPIGAGDVLTAALAAALERGVGLVDAVREGVAAASAAVEHPTAGRFEPRRMHELMG
jgi:sugar/nucleoside kinase (ribokinase family)